MIRRNGMRSIHWGAILVLGTTVAAAALPYELLVGVDARKYPAASRYVFPNPGPGYPGTFADGDRLAGNSPTGGTVTFKGVGTTLYPTPLLPPNNYGSLSFICRRGSIPVGGSNVVPFMGIEFLGGPLLDCDGNLNNGTRSLVPIVNTRTVEIPGTFSAIDLAFDLNGGTATVNDFDSTGTNEAGPGIQAPVATTLTVIAGTTNNGGKSGTQPNPAFDSRSGDVTAFTGTGGTLQGVYKIDDLRVELWNDSIDPNTATAQVLGTLQHFFTLRGWLVKRNPTTGMFPTLAGQGIGSTLWPAIDAVHVGNTFNTANGLAGGTATILDGNPSDVFTNQTGGLATADLGAYLDAVVAPRIAVCADSFVYLESAGFGINNSGDPVFSDTTGYDVVIIAQAHPRAGDIDGDGDMDAADRGLFVATLLDPAAQTACVRGRCDLNNDGQADGADIQEFVTRLIGP